MFKYLAVISSGALMACAMTVAAAAADTPKAVDLLFEGKHIAQLPAGTELVYKFERKPSDEKQLGEGFSDNIKMKIEGEGAPGKKNVVLEIYSGERAREPHHSTDLDGNPILLVYLDTALGHFRQLAGGDQAYLKNAFSQSFAKDANVTPVKVSYKGADVDGYRVTVTPYAKDPNRSKMKGWQVAEFSLVLSDQVPGKFAQMVSKFNNSDAASPTLVESTTLDGVSEVK